MIIQPIVNDFFANLYLIGNVAEEQARFNSFEKTGAGLASVIPSNTKILDVGCGRNFFKPLFPNLIGIDPVTEEADFKVSLQDFVTTEKFDVIFCFGAVQFGTIDDIRSQIAKMKALLNPGGKIKWRCNPTMASEFFAGFDWTLPLHTQLSNEFGFDIEELGESPTTPSRIFATWVLRP